jgi:hypothetical protein
MQHPDQSARARGRACRGQSRGIRGDCHPRSCLNRRGADADLAVSHANGNELSGLDQATDRRDVDAKVLSRLLDGEKAIEGK